MPLLFDHVLRAQRRDRAARSGPALFLHERAFADLLERLPLFDRRFGRALIIGCPDPAWRERLKIVADEVAAVDPGPLFAAALDEDAVREEQLGIAPGSVDLIVAIGTLDTIDDLPGTLRRLALALRAGGLLIGAMSGGDTLPRLRAAMLAAGKQAGAAQAHVHPRIEAAALAPLLEQAGLVRPVVDVDRVRIAYGSFGRLVADLRAMAATNVLRVRPRTGLTRSFRADAESAFAAAGSAGKTLETIEVLHFMAWQQAPAA
ncbi:MAG: methyltransferase domain-containing protein [Sphingomicrobium sp.]